MEIVKGTIAKTKLVTIYGIEGIGKSTLGSKLPKCLFLDCEAGSSELDVDRVLISDWGQVQLVLDELLEKPSGYNNIVIDTIDALDELCIAHICELNNIEDIGGLAFGRGYEQAGKEFLKMFKKLMKLRDNGYGVLVLAHSAIKKFAEPGEEPYDHYELKLSKKACAITKEKSDELYFTTHDKKFVSGPNDSKKVVSDGKRYLYTTHTPKYDAKTRVGMPAKMLLDYESIQSLFVGGGDAVDPTVEKIEKTNPIKERKRRQLKTMNGSN